MIRSEELIDELIASLHFHNYLRKSSSDIYGGGYLNVLATDRNKQNIQNYIDDLYIDYFFRTQVFKPIIIPKGCRVQVYSKKGSQCSDEGIELNLNNPFDRYTFIGWVLNSIMSRDGYLSKLYPKNRFFGIKLKKELRYGPIWECLHFILNSPRGDEFYQYQYYLYTMNQPKYDPQYRANDIINYSNLYHSSFSRSCYQGLTLQASAFIRLRQMDYLNIKDLSLFGDYTIEDILMIYCLLVYKFKMSEDNLLAFIGLFAYHQIERNSFFNTFFKFENNETSIDNIKPFIRDRDLFLRFTSSTNSKAVKFHFLENDIAEIQFFKEKAIQTIWMNNTLPLPFLYNELYK